MPKLTPILLLATLFLPTTRAASQSPYIDSLKNALVQAKDTHRVNTLNKLASAHWYTDVNVTKQYASQSIQLATQLGFDRGLASAQNNMGVAYYQQNRYDSAVHWYNKAVESHKRSGNFTGEGWVLSNIGMIYWKQGQLATAVEYYLQSLSIWDKHKVENEKAGVYDNLGNVYNEQEDYDRALDYYFKAYELEKRFNMSTHFTSMTLSNIGTAYLSKEEPIKAVDYFRQSLQLLGDDEKESQAVAISNIGLAYIEMKRFDSANFYLNQALVMQEQIEDSDAMLHTLVGLAKSAFETHDLSRSSAFANRALILAKNINDNNILEEVYLMLSDISIARNNHKEAYDYYVKYVASRDSINNRQNIYKIAHLQAGFETQKKQAQIEVLQKEQQQAAFRRNALIAGLVALLIIAALIVNRQRMKIRNAKQLQQINNHLTAQSYQLEEQARKLRELDQVKSTFFANISHEFRTPLTLILNSLSDKINNLKSASTAEEREQLEVMNRNAKRLLNLINQLLDLSKLDAGKMKLNAEPCDVNQLLTTIHASFGSLALSRQIQFKLSLPPQTVITKLDIDKTEKIIYNLLSNAFKFTPIGGTIHLIGSYTENLITIIVEDDGFGIPADQLDKIFDRFYQGKQYHSDEQGTGIGLALTKELVELHKGSIRAENKDKGSRFVVQLPFIPTNESAITLPGSMPARIIELSVDEEMDNAPANASDEARPTILVVEDNEDLRRYINKTLQPEFDVIVAENGRKGSDLAIKKIPDLVITDWMMPEMDGVTLCRILKTDERTSHIPVIILTALATDEAKLQGLETGADDYLTKPFDSRELMVRVKNLIENRRLLREKFGRELHLAPKKVQVSSMDEKFLEKVMETVETYMGDPDFDMEKFGQQVGLSRMQLHRKLKAITGYSPGDFLRIMRLKRAKQLLESRAGNVSEVAYEVGFNNLSYFSKCYREQYKISPNEAFSANVTKV